MKKESKLISAYGANEAGLAAMPHKISGTFISRICVAEEMGCNHCFPHGIETSNDYWSKQQRNWKKNRKTQWKNA